MGKLFINGKEALNSMNLASNISYNTDEEFENPNALKPVLKNGDYILAYGTWNGGGEPSIECECEETIYNKTNIFASDDSYKSCLGLFKKAEYLNAYTFDASSRIIFVGKPSSLEVTFLDEGFDKTVRLSKADAYIVVPTGIFNGVYTETMAEITDFKGCECELIDSCSYGGYQNSKLYFVKPNSDVELTFDEHTSQCYIIKVTN